MNTSSVQRVEDGTRTRKDFDFPGTEVLNVKVGGASHPFVSFDEPTLDPGALCYPVADLLQAGLDGVQNVIVPELEKFINSP